MCWRPCAGVRAGHLGARAGAVDVGLHPQLALAGAEPEPDPVQRGVARDLRALAAEDPRLLREVLHAQVLDRRALAHDDLGDGVEVALEVGLGGQPLLGDGHLRARLDHDQRAPRQRGARAPGSRRPRSAPRPPRRRARARTGRRASSPCSGRRTCRGRSPGTPRCGSTSSACSATASPSVLTTMPVGHARRVATRGAVDLQHARAVRRHDRLARGLRVEVTVAATAPSRPGRTSTGP